MKVLIDSATGKDISWGTVFAEKLPVGTELIGVGRTPDFSVERWDAVSRTLVPVQAVSDPDRETLTVLAEKPSSDYTLKDVAEFVKLVARRL